jgi:hypothetical protein
MEESMGRLAHAIKDWPILVQGAIGSGLFWLFLVLGQKITALCSARLSVIFKERRNTVLFNQLLRIRAYYTSADATGGAYATILWYRASRDLIKGLIWLALGLSFRTFIGVLGVVGFVGSLFYFFAALNTVKPMTDDGNLVEKEKQILEQLKKAQHS